MLSILRSGGRSSSRQLCRRSIVNNIWQFSVRSRPQLQSTSSSSTPLLTGRVFPAKHNGPRSLCTLSDSSQEIKSLKRQRFFWFGVTLAASIGTYFYLDLIVYKTIKVAAINAASLDDESVMPLRGSLYALISSNPQILSKIGPSPGIGRPFYCSADSKSLNARLPLYSNGKCVGQANVKVPHRGQSGAGSEAELANNRKSSTLDSDLKPLFGWEVELLVGREVIKVPLPSRKK